MTVCLIFILDC